MLNAPAVVSGHAGSASEDIDKPNTLITKWKLKQ